MHDGSMSVIFSLSNPLEFPAAAAKQHHSHYCDRGFGDRNCGEGTPWTKRDAEGEGIRERYLKEPVAENIHDGWGGCIAGAVEGLHHYHSVSVRKVPITDDAQAVDAEWNDLWVVGEEPHDRRRKCDQQHRDKTEKDHVV